MPELKRTMPERALPRQDPEILALRRDSPEEGAGFEPSVPLRLGAGLQAKTLRADGEERVWGIRPWLRSGE
jgi:hypothetical protein